MSNYWLFNVNYKMKPDVWRKCKEYGFVAMHYYEGKDNPALIKPNLERIKAIKKDDFIIAYSGNKSFLGIGKAKGDFLVDLPDLKEKEKKGRNQKGKVDFYKNGLENKGLGNKGEEFALAIEKAKLMKAGKEDLIDKIVYVA